VNLNRGLNSAAEKPPEESPAAVFSAQKRKQPWKHGWEIIRFRKTLGK